MTKEKLDFSKRKDIVVSQNTWPQCKDERMQNLHDENKNRIRENSLTMTKVPPQLILYLFGHAQYACQKNQFTRDYERKKLEIYL